MSDKQTKVGFGSIPGKEKAAGVNKVKDLNATQTKTKHTNGLFGLCSIEGYNNR